MREKTKLDTFAAVTESMLYYNLSLKCEDNSRFWILYMYKNKTENKLGAFEHTANRPFTSNVLGIYTKIDLGHFQFRS